MMVSRWLGSLSRTATNLVSAWRAGSWRFRLPGLLFVLAVICIAAALIEENPSAVAMAAPAQGYSIAIKDGLLTGTFLEMTDDNVLIAAIPDLIANGVQ